MNTLNIRFFLFIFGCIGSRIMLTVLSAYSRGWFLQLLGLFAILPVIGWFYIIFIGKRDTGLEVFGDKIWWKNLRPIHMLLWGFFAYLALSKNSMAWIALAVDTTFGLTSFLMHHQSVGNLAKMIRL